MLKCQDVEQKIGSDEIHNAGLMERLGVSVHLMMCRHCRNYARQLRAIGNAARSVWGGFPEDRDNLARLRDLITKEQN